MRLEGDQGWTLELAIERYEFPESVEYWDANWLLIRGHVEHPLGAWTFRDPCLTTFELEQLARWFDGVADGRVDPDSGYFTEPNLRFDYSPTPTPSIQVTLAYESAPPWLKEREERFDGAVMTFPAGSNDPRAASRSLRALLAEYPVRGVPEGAA